ncbi:hypothetical protein BDA96_06G081700 [Sorghum bicolor]|uniref:Uncharacterized protein n=2 Tax=Sorghum bicolor TaxID=4558 RepID=A0A921UBM7_SORBI|nr:hypothetical protein BDA96_06G081700 [Sorghum bicolor]OQU81540.1 hypothetical protein SORBI_3006G074150 [Sorghum bicolor]
MEYWPSHGGYMEHDADPVAWWSPPPNRRWWPIPHPIYGGGSICTTTAPPTHVPLLFPFISRLQWILWCCNRLSEMF